MNQVEVTSLKKWMTEYLLPNADVDNWPTLSCGGCNETLHIGDSIQYETSGYTAYCDSTECTEGIATHGTCLEHCWWGEEDDFWVFWKEVLEEAKEKIFANKDVQNLIKKEVKEIINAKNKQS